MVQRVRAGPQPGPTRVVSNFKDRKNLPPQQILDIPSRYSSLEAREQDSDAQKQMKLRLTLIFAHFFTSLPKL